jgi:hypothetical protein
MYETLASRVNEKFLLPMSTQEFDRTELSDEEIMEQLADDFMQQQKVNLKENIAIARHEVKVTLEEIIKEASVLLKFGGDFYIVHQEDRLVDIFVLMRKYKLEPKELKILNNKKGNIILIKAKKGGKGGMKITL